MTLSSRVSTQDLRDVRTPWAGPGPSLLQLGGSILILAVALPISGWLNLRVLDHEFSLSSGALADAAGAIPFGLGFSLSLHVLAGVRPRIRHLLAMWILCSTVWFITQVDLPVAQEMSFPSKAVMLVALWAITRLLRGPLRKFLGPGLGERKAALEADRYLRVEAS